MNKNYTDLDDDAPESGDSDGDYVPPLDGDDDWIEDEDELISD